jgi:hypothetical protein
MERFLQENVWLDWDIEHTAGGVVSAGQINQVADAYFARRQGVLSFCALPGRQRQATEG